VLLKPVAGDQLYESAPVAVRVVELPVQILVGPAINILLLDASVAFVTGLVVIWVVIFPVRMP
jgi:hypothetical protein